MYTVHCTVVPSQREFTTKEDFVNFTGIYGFKIVKLFKGKVHLYGLTKYVIKKTFSHYRFLQSHVSLL